jgi:hypothetical protein
MTEETLSEFDIYCANRLASIFIVQSSVNIVQYLFSCGSVALVGTSRTREFMIEFTEEYRGFSTL